MQQLLSLEKKKKKISKLFKKEMMKFLNLVIILINSEFISK